VGVISGIAVFFMIWWTVIFCALPFGVRPPDHSEQVQGQMPGAPVRHNLGKKMLWTTAISILMWLAVYALIEADIISFRDLAGQMP
jgi:predicted secreted protein